MFLLLSSASGSPADGNVALDAAGQLFSNLNPSANFWAQCTQFSDIGHCRLGGRGLRGIEYDGASDWHSVGSFARYGEEYSLDFVLFDGADPSFDSFVLLDNFRLIEEVRSDRSYGEQRVSDLQMAMVRAVPDSVRSSSREESFTLRWTVRNLGPDVAADIHIYFMAPIGTAFVSASHESGDPLLCSPFNDVPNPLWRCRLVGASPVLTSAHSLSGSVELAVLTGYTGMIEGRLTVSSSSIDDFSNNNYRRFTVMAD
eukprot:TRINITY_DN1068_c0_g1_i1.p2 TRINITY_DN1068_c0_g1~~TRINITY_DN1068_c0_g1_i1.p2  ORF type:complete len:276 (+),score=112.98 TRINITY_DN1068_c0_g1_i1:58-828(+)